MVMIVIVIGFHNPWFRRCGHRLHRYSETYKAVKLNAALKSR